jgi:hypothetical protein
MKKIKSFSIVYLFAIIALFPSCEKDVSNTPGSSSDLKCKSYNVYDGSDLSELALIQSVSLEYNADNQLVSKIESYYDESELLLTTNHDYTYQQNLVVESVRLNIQGDNYFSKTFFHLNAQGLVIKDSSIDYDNDIVVHHFTYNNQNKRVYRYISDTLDGGFVYLWNQNNLEQEFLISQMGRFPINSFQYSSTLNTIDLGDFWYNGEKSENLLDKSIDPNTNSEYRYTHKIESDGFVSEQIIAYCPTGGEPHWYTKTVFVR